MKTKFSLIIFTILILLSFNLIYSETQIANIEKEIKEIVKKCSPSVAKVISEDGRRIISSGVVIDNGYILAHSQALYPEKEIFVENFKGEKSKAEVVGVDWENSIALLKVDGKYFQMPKFGEVSKVEVGDWIIAIGASFENFPSASFGIVNSVTENELNVSLATPPGGSGSGVFNSKGELIGVLRGNISERDVWISLRRDRKEEISFSSPGGTFSMIIPVKRAKEIYEDLKKTGYEKRPYLGVSVKEVDGRVIVQSLWKNSPAEKAGLKPNDYIISIDGKRVYTSEELSKIIKDKKIGDKVTIEIERDGKVTKKEVLLEEAPKGYFSFPMPPAPSFPPPIPFFKIPPKSYLGVVVDNVPKGVEPQKGAYVKKVDDGSPADKAGLRERDIIISVDGEKIFSPDDLIEVIKDKKPGDRIEIEFVRDGKENKCKATLARRKEWTWYWDWDDFSKYFKIEKEKIEKEQYKMQRELEEQLKKLKQSLRENFDSIKIMVKKRKEGIEI
jgi:serine protease Do